MKFANNWTLASKVLSPFTVDHALYARDALAKAVYGHTFTWLVNKINASMENKVRRPVGDRSLRSTFKSVTEVFVLTTSSSGFLTEDCDRSVRHLRI